MADPEAPDPIVYPRILLEGQSVEIKFRIGDLIRLSKAGLDIGDITPVKGAQAYERSMLMLQAGVAHSLQKTVEELSDMITISELPVITEAVNAAFEQARIMQEKVNARHLKPPETPKPETLESAPIQEIPSSVG